MFNDSHRKDRNGDLKNFIIRTTKVTNHVIIRSQIRSMTGVKELL